MVPLLLVIFFLIPYPAHLADSLELKEERKKMSMGGYVWETGTQKPSLRVQFCLSVRSSKQILKRGLFVSRGPHLEGSSEPPHVIIHWCGQVAL